MTSDPVELVLGTTVAGWVLIAVLLRIFSGPSYDESVNEQRGRDDVDL